MSEEVNLDIHGQLEKLIAISRREVVEVVEVLSDSHKGSCDAYRDCMFRFVNAIINGNSLDDLHKKILPLDNPRHDRADEESKVYRGAYRNTIRQCVDWGLTNNSLSAILYLLVNHRGQKNESHHSA